MTEENNRISAQEAVLIMTEESILSFLRAEKDRGASADCLRQNRRFVSDLYDQLPEGKGITKEALNAWRAGLHEKGYSSVTVRNYVIDVNRYLGHVGRSDLQFKKGRPTDLTDRQFGYLTALEPTGEYNRKDIVWHCRCKCGNVINLPATRLLTGNTLSCGCLRIKRLQKANMCYGGTSIARTLEDHVLNKRAKSGYTGVYERNGKWKAQIHYKGRCYYLGTYGKLEDAVKARAKAKELVQEDAQALLESYQNLLANGAPIPTRSGIERDAKGKET